MSIFLSIQNHSQWGSVLFWTPLTFIVWTKTVKKKWKDTVQVWENKMMTE